MYCGEWSKWYVGRSAKIIKVCVCGGGGGSCLAPSVYMTLVTVINPYFSSSSSSTERVATIKSVLAQRLSGFLYQTHLVNID